MDAEIRRALKLHLDRQSRRRGLEAGDLKIKHVPDPLRHERERVIRALRDRDYGTCQGMLKAGRLTGLIRCTHRARADGYCRKHGPNASRAYIQRGRKVS
jgi:hypothetical protein